MEDKKIMIVGGYGGVGRTIARLLSKEFPQRVIVAGRNYDKANQLSVELEHTVLPLKLDISSETFPEKLLDEVSLIVMCIDQQDTRFVEECIRQGVDYIDITSGYEFISKLEALNADAEKGGSTIVSSVGLAPGLTNVLASLAVSKGRNVSHIDLFVMVGLGEEHGEAAERWTVENLSTTFKIRDHQGFRQVRSFHESKTTQFPEGLGARRAYRFNFSDQHVIPNTLKIDSASTWLCLDSTLFTELLALLEKVGVLKVLRYRAIQNILVRILRSLHFGSDIFVLKAEAYRHSEDESPSFECSLVGYGEGYATGMVAAKVASLVFKSSLSSGAFHMEQIVDPSAFIKEVEKEGLKFNSRNLG
ncbi:MAG: saccharopine dehydrogenase NADP-binding domain-containing protein [Anaerolineales bacterium]|nr:saccharopine dehydrogenase NADP-binding domain-containing protein [Anaerolineales bacterium]